MESSSDLQEPDESRPVKRARLEAPLATTEEFQEQIDDEDGWDDIYGAEQSASAKRQPLNGADEITSCEAAVRSGQTEHHQTDDPSLSQAARVAGTDAEQLSQGDGAVKADQTQAADTTVDDGVPVEAIDQGDDIVGEGPPPATADAPAAQVLQESTQIEDEAVVDPPNIATDASPGGLEADAPPAIAATAPKAEPTEMDVMTQEDASESRLEERKPKPAADPEFLEAAAAQKGNAEAEWQFDASDAESSSDSDSDSSSDDSSDSDSDGGYEMLDAATAAKMLMSGDADDDDGGKGNKSGGDRQPRTANEVKEEVVPKPDVVVTPDMKITHLGLVEYTVENMVLIKASTPGEYQVLESGSVLCNEDREVIGAVAETFGRVQEPLYSVAFTNAQDVADAGLVIGTKVFYVDSHSTFVFTQPLRNLKGTDASNIHDEEVGEDEIEFSDDEKEAEYKRMKKLAKRGGRGGLSRSAFMAGAHAAGAVEAERPFINASDAPQQQYGSGMSYDDEEAQDDFYNPLRRPENLSQMMASGGPPRAITGGLDRGRGKPRGEFRGRGRGDRGRGRGGFDRNANRSSRGGAVARGHSGNAGDHRGSAHSFPDRHNGERRANELPAKPATLAPPSGPTYHQQQPAPSTYQFNGYTFQYGAPPPPNLMGNFVQAPPMAPGTNANPAMFPHQPQHVAQQARPVQAHWPQQQSVWGAQPAPYGGGQWPTQYAPQQAAQQPQQQQQQHQQQQQRQQQQQPDLADILRQLGGQRQQ